MAMASLLEVKPLSWKQSFFRIQSPPPHPIFRHRCSNLAVAACFSTKAVATFNGGGGCSAAAATKAKFSIKCFSMKQQKQQSLSWSSSSLIDDEKEEITQAKIPLDVILHVLKVLRKPATVAVFLGALLIYDPYNLAMAASGGRMGGSSFPSRSSSSRSSSSSYSSSYSSSPSCSSSFRVCFLILAFLAAMIYLAVELSNRKSVLRLQVGLLGLGRSIQSDLNKIAEVADTSTPKGLSYILSETVMALLRLPDYYISSYSSVDVKWSMEDVAKHFNQLSMEERSKFDEETLVNVNNIKRQSAAIQRASGFSDDCIVITILVAVEGIHKLPTINSSDDLKEALLKLGSFHSCTTLAVEVLWTPQNEDDTLSKQELLEGYPLLKPL